MGRYCPNCGTELGETEYKGEVETTQKAFSILIAIISIGIGYFGGVLSSYTFLFWQKYDFWLGFKIAFITFIGFFLLLIYMIPIILKRKK